MKRRSAFLTFAACALMAAHAPAKDKSPSPTASPSPTSSAILKLLAPHDFTNVQVITFKDNNVGFFDRKTGKLYIYNADLSKCLAIKQLEVLGEPVKTVDNP